MTPVLTGTRHVPGTRPYAWPWDGQLDLARTAVLVVCTRATSDLNDPATAVAAAASSGAAAVVHVSTGPPDGPPQRPQLAGPAPTAAFSAYGWDGFGGTGLDLLLRRLHVDYLLLVGDGLETGIHSTMRSANDRGYECLLVADACAPGDPSLVGPALSMVEMSGGIFGAVGSSAEVLLALADARTHANEQGETR